MIYRVATEMSFRAGHYLMFEPSGGENLHEHEWKVRVSVESAQLDKTGLVMDFHRLAGLLKEVVTPLTKVEAMNSLPAFAKENPSTERVARYIYEQLHGEIPAGARLREVVVWETPDCRASYGV
jgi:6-pyruvoyltetrahydropterin/6-carboxytetrahydropterin synthase